MTAEATETRWRAKAIVLGQEWEYEGRWRPYKGARAQADRWCKEYDLVWLEADQAGQIEVIQWDDTYGRPDGYQPE
jgi:hypothetical protein